MSLSPKVKANVSHHRPWPYTTSNSFYKKTWAQHDSNVRLSQHISEPDRNLPDNLSKLAACYSENLSQLAGTGVVSNPNFNLKLDANLRTLVVRLLCASVLTAGLWALVLL